METREITPLDAVPHPVDFRVITSVKRPPERLIKEKKLRTNLFHRCNATVFLPPLRDREDDVFLPVAHFVAEGAKRYDLPRSHLDSTLRRCVASHHWPGNVREARNFSERLMIGLDTNFASLPVASNEGGIDCDAAMVAFEARLLRSALIQTGGRKSEAAELLDIPRKRLYLRLRHRSML